MRPMVGWDETSVRVSVTKDEVDTKSVKPLRDENEKSDRISRGLGRFKKTEERLAIGHVQEAVSQAEIHLVSLWWLAQARQAQMVVPQQRCPMMVLVLWSHTMVEP